MRGALNIGITQAEIKEMIIHLSQYSGVPTAVEAIERISRAHVTEAQILIVPSRVCRLMIFA